MAESHLAPLARNIAAGAVAEVGRGRALTWALRLLTTVRSSADLRDVALIVWAVLTVAPAT